MHDEYDHLRESADADVALVITERRIHLARLTAIRGSGGSVEDVAAPAQLDPVTHEDPAYARGWNDAISTPGLHEPGESHQYRLQCEVCGQRGQIQVSIEPQRA